MLSEEQVKQIKSQLLKQIEKFPEKQREAARAQIESMNSEQLEEFLMQNRLIKSGGEEPTGCIFCNIIEGKTASYKIAENKNSIAVLDINPMSKGQTLIIPFQHKTIEKLSSSVLSLAKKIAKRLKSKIKPQPEEIKIETSSIQGHGIITVLPLYKDRKLERKQASQQELIALQEKLKSRPRGKRKKKQINISELPLAPVRIP